MVCQFSFVCDVLPSLSLPLPLSPCLSLPSPLPLSFPPSLPLSLPLLLVITPSSGSADVIKFPPPDLILGTGHLSSQLLLFTLHQGVVAVSQTSVVSSSSTATPGVTKTSRTVATSSRYIMYIVPQNVHVYTKMTNR